MLLLRVPVTAGLPPPVRTHVLGYPQSTMKPWRVQVQSESFTRPVANEPRGDKVGFYAIFME